ncbi:GGDEF domain-containing response regulator [Agaribacter marinus]|uniref:diguanylate cyclase n=1 Tax=Agaribacter marinus TaxID=1431249 RepID=A0AA37WIX6_9ALTE|nr:response regulator [Agaribacter marinus]GLR71478.1 diguanylate cyclase [Agaribacter marinus]
MFRISVPQTQETYYYDTLKQLIELWANARKSRKKAPFVEFNAKIRELSNEMAVYAVYVLHHQLEEIKQTINNALNENIPLKVAVSKIDTALNVLIYGSKTQPDPILAEMVDGDHASIIAALCQTAKNTLPLSNGDTLIAVIDDEKSVGVNLCTALKQFNYNAEYFANIQDYKQSTLVEKCTLVILDVTMPDYIQEEVFSFASALQASGVNVIACSCLFNLETRLAAVRAGVSDYIVKPISSYSLFEKISRILQRQQDDSFNIVLVDDQESMGIFYKTVFEQAGCHVEYIQTAQKLLDSLEYLKPDLFLLDMMMPDIDGLEIASMLRQEEKFDFAPIVFLTADDRLETKLRVLDSGADDVIAKSTPAPLVVKQVMARLNRSSVIRNFVSKDALTGVLNHGQIVESASNVLRLSKRHGNDSVLALVDVDYFKTVNDSYGHSNGDQVLRALGQQLRRTLRESDHVGRYGGEEFLLLLQDCDLASAVEKLDKLREAFSNIKFKYESGYFNVTFSVGVVALEKYAQIQDAINEADVRLYAAKDAGRNQIKYS